MSVFRRYEKFLESPFAHLKKDKAALELKVFEYTQKTSAILDSIIKRFMEKGMFPELKIVSFLKGSFRMGDKHFAAACLFFTGEGFSTGQNLAADQVGIKYAERFAQAAKKHNVPIVKCPKMNFVITEKGQKTENGPRFLLLGLAAFAAEKGEADLVKVAVEAAVQVKELVKSFEGFSPDI